MPVELLRTHPRTRTFLIGALLNSLGGGLTLPIMVVYLHQVVGMSLSSASAVFSWSAVVGLAVSPFVGSLVDRIGPRPILLSGIVVKATAMALWPSVHGTVSVYAVATLAALGDSSIWPPQTTMMARMVPDDDRQKFFGLQFMMLNLGLGAGGMISSFMVNIHDHASFTRLYLLDAGSYLTFFVFIASLRGIGGRLTEEERGSRHSGSWREVLADRRLVRLTCASVLILIAGYASVDTGMPAMLTTVGGLDVSDLGPVWAVNTTLIVILQLVMLGRIAGRSRTRLLAVVCGLWAVSWVINGVGVLSHTAVFATACLATAVFAVGETIWSPIGATLQNQIAPEHLRGRYNSLGALSWVVSGSIGPLISGFMLQAQLVAQWIGLLIGLLAVAALVVLRLGKVLTPEENGLVAH